MGRPVQATARSVDAIDGRSWPSGVAMGGAAVKGQDGPPSCFHIARTSRVNVLGVVGRREGVHPRKGVRSRGFDVAANRGGSHATRECSGSCLARIQPGRITATGAITRRTFMRVTDRHTTPENAESRSPSKNAGVPSAMRAACTRR